MNLSISNIAWPAEYDIHMYKYLNDIGFSGIEIAPTRLFPENPYGDLKKVRKYADYLINQYGLCISSMQSILFGKSERLFGGNAERKLLVDYTKKAINFASALYCNNIVFGSPKIRNMSNVDEYHIAIEFFKDLGLYAQKQATVISIEPNPEIYGTNFINYSEQAFELVKEIDCDGFKVNLDLGTVIQNNEDISVIIDNIYLINHIHISEPNLVPIEKRELHKELAKILRQKGYNNFISIEMRKLDDIQVIKAVMQYVKEVFLC